MLQFLNVEADPGSRPPIHAVCKILCNTVRGLPGSLRDLTVDSFQYDILLCPENLVSDMRHVSELLVPGFGRPVLLCRGKIHRARGTTATYEMLMENQNLRMVIVKCWFLGFDV